MGIGFVALDGSSSWGGAGVSELSSRLGLDRWMEQTRFAVGGKGDGEDLWCE